MRTHPYTLASRMVETRRQNRVREEGMRRAALGTVVERRKGVIDSDVDGRPCANETT